MSNLDPLALGEAWNLSQGAVKARLTGKRALTLSEICALADLVGIGLLLDALGGPIEKFPQR